MIEAVVRLNVEYSGVQINQSVSDIASGDGHMENIDLLSKYEIEDTSYIEEIVYRELPADELERKIISRIAENKRVAMNNKYKEDRIFLRNEGRLDRDEAKCNGNPQMILTRVERQLRRLTNQQLKNKGIVVT